MPGSSTAAKGWFVSTGKRWGWHLVDVELSHIPQGRSGNDSSPATLARGWEKGERQTLRASLKCLGSPPRQSLHSCKSKPSSALGKGLDPTRSSCARGVKTSTRHWWHFPGLSAQGGKPRLPPSRSGNLPKAAANECFWSVTCLLSAAEPSGVFAQEQLLTLTAELGAPSWLFFPPCLHVSTCYALKTMRKMPCVFFWDFSF